MTTSSDDILLGLGAMALMGWFMFAGQKIEDHYCDWKTKEEIKLGTRDKNDEPVKNQGFGMAIGFILCLLFIIIIRIFY